MKEHPIIWVRSLSPMSVIWVASSLACLLYNRLLPGKRKKYHLHAGIANFNNPTVQHHENHSLTEETNTVCPLLRSPSLEMCFPPTQATDKMGNPVSPPMSFEEVSPKRRKVRVDEEESDNLSDEDMIRLLDAFPPLSNLPTPPLSQETSPRPTTLDGPDYPSQGIFTSK